MEYLCWVSIHLNCLSNIYQKYIEAYGIPVLGKHLCQPSNICQKYIEARGIPVLGKYSCQLSVQLQPELRRGLWDS